MRTTSRTWRTSSARSRPRFPTWQMDRSCSARLSFPSAPSRSSSRRGARRPPGGRFHSRVHRRTCGSARRSRCSRTLTASSSVCATTALATRVQALLAADHGSHRVDVGRVGGDDEARRERVSRHVRDVHQRAGGALRAHRRGRERGRARPQDRAADRSTRLPVAWRRVCRRHARARCDVSAHAGIRDWAGRHRSWTACSRATRRTACGRAGGSSPISEISPERRSPSGVLPTSPARTRFAGPTPSNCAGGSSARAPRCTCTIRLRRRVPGRRRR